MLCCYNGNKWFGLAADLGQHLAVVLHTTDQVLLHGHVTHLLIQIVLDAAAGLSAGLLSSSGLREFTRRDADASGQSPALHGSGSFS